MHRSDAQIAQERRDALGWYEERLGVDPATDNVSLRSESGTMFDPRNNYRAYVVGGEKVPASGWVVRDGGFGLVVAKGGAVFHGTYGGAAGIWVPDGTSVTFGNYNIQRTTGASGAEKEPLILRYRSDFPIRPADEDGVRTFRCQLIDPETGEHGIAQGVIAPPRDAGDGKIQVSIRDMLTFPGY
jgi:hypothetical protein